MSIFKSLCSNHGFETPCIDEYLEDHRSEIANILWETQDVPPGETKAMFLSLLYGAPFVAHCSNTVTKKLGYPVVEILRDESWFGDFVEEIKKGRDLILGECPRNQGVTTNVMGKETDAPERRKRLAHILFGYERWCLETVCKDFEDTKALIYDGWISPKRDVKKLEQSIVERSTEEFGFPIDLRIEMVIIPDSVDEILEMGVAKQ